MVAGTLIAVSLSLTFSLSKHQDLIYSQSPCWRPFLQFSLSVFHSSIPPTLSLCLFQSLSFHLQINKNPSKLTSQRSFITSASFSFAIIQHVNQYGLENKSVTVLEMYCLSGSLQQYN